MDWITQTVAGNTAVAAGLAALALITMRLKKPALAHVLWLLVLVKLITPAVVKAPVKAEWAGEVVTQFAGSEDRWLPTTIDGDVPAAPAAARAGSLNWRLIGGVGWLGGSVVVLGVAAVRVARFRRVLNSAAKADQDLLGVAGSLARRVGLDWCPDVRLVGGAATTGPMVYFDASRRPAVVLPARLVGSLGRERLAAILAHELAHLRRGDHWVRFVETLVVIVLWWHPLVWVARRGLHEAEEQACDAWVVHTLPHARRAYAEALVDAVERFPDPAPLVASGLGRVSHLKRRIVMIVTQSPSRKLSAAAKIFVVTAVMALPVSPDLVWGQEASAPAAADAAGDATKDREIAALKARVAALEKELAERERAAAAPAADVAKADPLAAPRAQIEALRAKARQRAATDAKKYNNDQLGEAEDLYQVANKNWRTPEAKASLEKMVEKYPDINRTGCAMLYLGQYSRGEDRVKYMTQAYQKHGDCLYFNGVQVGAYARYLLALTLKDLGKVDEAKALLDEVVKEYPQAVDHGGRSLVKVIEQVNAQK